MPRAKLAPSLVPSKILMQFLDRVTSSYDAPILDAPCGFGRNALALAAEGYDVIAVDKDMDRLRSVKKSAAVNLLLGSNPSGKVFSIRADLATSRLPFGDSSFSAILCIHYPVQRIISDLDALLKRGGHFYIETFQGHGENHLELPDAEEIRHALSGYELLFYKERSVGPTSRNSVVVEALAQKR